MSNGSPASAHEALSPVVGDAASRRGSARLVIALTVALVSMIVAIAFVAGTGEPGVRMMIRATARTSLALFLLAFTASSLRQLLPAPPTAWLVRNRRALGVSFAVSHLLHLVAIIVVGWRWPHPFVEQSTQPLGLIGGGLGYVFVFAMAATSWDGAVAWMGGRRWRRLHTAGSYYLWMIFAQAYVLRAVVEPSYIPPALVVVGALVLRLARRRAQRRARNAGG